MAIRSINPATGDILEEFEPLTDLEVREKLDRAAATFEVYRKSTFEDRRQWLLSAGDILESEKKDLATIMTREMGKPIAAAVAEAEKCALACRYYAERAEDFLRDEEVETNAQRSYVRYLPIGPVLAVMPWNFPFWQVFRFASPALMAGNVGLLKHASNVPRCALTIEDVIRRAGFPDGAFQTLLVESEAVDGILGDSRVRAATLTGSTRAGSAVGSGAGLNIKKSVLELGGSDPFIVMPSADMALAAKTAVTARMLNNGQSCINAKRFIIHEKVYDDFVARLVDGMKALTIGDPLIESTKVGPLATPAIRDEVEKQVRQSVAAGARILTGGQRGDGKGNFYLPTVLIDIPRGSPAWSEEIFGPVASVIRVASAEEAIEVANDTSFGLGSAVWTRDQGEIDLFLDGIEAGQIFVNAMVASDPRLPFGGVKSSGYGRELGSWGIREFVNVQTVWMGGEPKAATDVAYTLMLGD